jgi:hypothetical protein
VSTSRASQLAEVGGDPRDVRAAAVVFDGDEDVEAAQEHGIAQK